MFKILPILIFCLILSGCDSDKKSETNFENVPVQTLISKEDSERKIAEQVENDEQLLLKSSSEIYQWCYQMFYKIGFSDDVLQYHMSNGDSESMRDLKFVMGQFQKDLKVEFLTDSFKIPENIPQNIKFLMQKAKNDLMQSLILRESAAKKLLGDSVSNSESADEMIDKSNQLKDSVEEQLRQIQELLPEGIKYSTWAEVYDPND